MTLEQIDNYKKYGIYSIKNNITGLMYIGKTSRSFIARWKEHKRSLNQNLHKNFWLQKDWSLYKEHNFEFSTIHIADELDNLDELEGYYIKKYNTYNFGYNEDLPKTCTYEDMRKLSEGTFLKNDVYEIKRLSRYSANPCELDKFLINNIAKYHKSSIIRINEIDSKRYFDISINDYLSNGIEIRNMIRVPIRDFKISSYT